MIDHIHLLIDDPHESCAECVTSGRAVCTLASCDYSVCRTCEQRKSMMDAAAIMGKACYAQQVEIARQCGVKEEDMGGIEIFVNGRLAT